MSSNPDTVNTSSEYLFLKKKLNAAIGLLGTLNDLTIYYRLLNSLRKAIKCEVIDGKLSYYLEGYNQNALHHNLDRNGDLEVLGLLNRVKPTNGRVKTKFQLTNPTRLIKVLEFFEEFKSNNVDLLNRILVKNDGRKAELATVWIKLFYLQTKTLEKDWNFEVEPYLFFNLDRQIPKDLANTSPEEAMCLNSFIDGWLKFLDSDFSNEPVDFMSWLDKALKKTEEL